MTATPSVAPMLFLIDGFALAYRSHFAFQRNPLVTRKGKLVSAIFGFSSTVLRILELEAPSHLAIVFDSREPTFRHKEYAEYKATREKMPDELVEQMPEIREVVGALGIPVLEMAGVEADDIIGTLAERAAGEGYHVRIVSGDKDFFQLVSTQVQMYSLGRGGGSGELLGEAAVADKFQVKPGQIIDLLALMGDSSDNVPGVPRVGPKTAAQLLAQFGTIDNLYQHLDEVKKPALRKSLEENQHLAELSRRLVTIRQDLDLGCNPQDFSRGGGDPQRVRELFLELEFQSLLEKVPDLAPHPAESIEVDYELIDTAEKLKALLARLRESRFFVLDTETTGLDPLRAKLVGIAVSLSPGQAAYIPARAPSGLFAQESGTVVLEQHRDQLAAILADPEIHKAGQNIKYDAHVLGRHGLPVEGIRFDTMLAHYCVQPSAASHSLDTLALEYFGHTKIKTKELIGKGRQQLNMAEMPLESLSEYACEDADYTHRLVERLREQMQEREVDSLFEQIEMPLLHVLQRMEAQGIALDVDSLHAMRSQFAERAEQLEKDIHALAGEPFNVNSPRQLGEILYERLELHKEAGLKRIPRTKTGYSTSAAALQQLHGHPLVQKVLEYRQVEKLLSTYVEALPKLIHPESGRLHTSFNQTVAATGRLSSSDPNLQNIPIRTPQGREIRRAFRSSHPEGTLISADYSQVELRILSHVSKDAHLIEAFHEDLDIHRQTASLVFQVALDEVDSSMRTRAKAINFGIIYGMGAQRLSRETGLSFAEAQEFIQRYFEVFAGVKQYLDETFQRAQELGYVTTLAGRRRYIPEIHSGDRRVAANAKNMAVNTPIQGSAADLIKLAMIAVDDALLKEGLLSRMVLQVHDELVFDTRPGEAEAVRKIARGCMENALDLRVPLKVDVGEGSSWLEAH